MTTYDFLAIMSPDTEEAAARKVIRELFSAEDVGHVNGKTFLPSFVVRRVLQRNELRTTDDAVRFRLGDWVSAEMLDYLISPGEQHRISLRELLRRCGLDLPALTLLHRALHECEPQDSLVFRLFYFASYGPQEVSRWLECSLDEAMERCLTVETAIVEALQSEYPAFELKHLHAAGMRPAGATTRILDEVRLGNMQLMDAIASDAFLRRFSKDVLETSIINEVILATAGAKVAVPENSERLAGYVGAIMRRLVAKRRAGESKYVPLKEQNSEGDTFAWDERMDRRPIEADFEEKVAQPRQQDLAAAMQRVLHTFRQDHRDLQKTFELCYMKDLEVKQIAEELEVDRSTVIRQEAKIQSYFVRRLKEEGVDVGHYESYPRGVRLENLYQLIEPMLRGELALPRRQGGYRSEMIEALSAMSDQDAIQYEVIRDSYLSKDFKRKELAQKFGVATGTYEEWQASAKRNLAESVRDIVRRRRERNL